MEIFKNLRELADDELGEDQSPSASDQSPSLSGGEAESEPDID